MKQKEDRLTIVLFQESDLWCAVFTKAIPDMIPKAAAKLADEAVLEYRKRLDEHRPMHG